MRAALWLLALFGIAVTAALFAGNNQATVTVFWMPYRVDLSLNFVILALGLAFVLLYVALRTMALLFGLPKQARRWRLLQKERALNAELFNSQSHFMAGRYIRARKSALAALSLDQTIEHGPSLGNERPANADQLRALAHVMAAQSAHALQDVAARDEHLQHALEHHNPKAAQETREGTQLLAANWALDDHDAPRALHWLAQLPQGAARRTLALRLKLKAAQLENLSAEALETTRLLAKHHAFSSTAAQSLIRSLALKLLDDARDTAQLQAVWRSLDPAERSQSAIAIHAAHRLNALHGDAQQIRAWLLPVWERMTDLDNVADRPNESQSVKLILTLEATSGSMADDWLAKIENAQRANPRDIHLQYLAGMAFKAHSLWGKAQQQLSHAAPQLKVASLKRNAWLALAELAEQRGETAAAVQAWKQAAQI
ncbi:MAG: heme biosynthesis HemY N-terminal domain-containing protein [Burkholderiaceae bacterium]|nr:heme biosynthesis HemY N-terminal domain-containing protein [Burkholderiaceae bacterium]